MSTDQKKADRLEFYGGSIGSWIPLGSLVVFMLLFSTLRWTPAI